jgi:asparagine synthase (glutamine-hydrolysing)
MLDAMLDSLKHEDFYISGTRSVPEMGIYAGWVALEGSFAAEQASFSEQDGVMLVFSGECFQDSPSQPKSAAKGGATQTNRAAWLIELYRQEGEKFFAKLNGLFSGLLIDKKRHHAFLFNDRYGIERIYWAETKEGIYFASEAKALLRVVPELRAFDETGLAQFLTYGCTLECDTLFRGVKLLPGASLWCFENGRCRKSRYFLPEIWEAQETLSAEAFEEEFTSALMRVVPRYFDSPSRIGISLTGGLDTRMILACRPRIEPSPVCYTFAAEKGETLDAILAAKLAEKCGMEHSLLRIGEDFLDGFGSHADKSVYVTDGCCSVLGSHEIYLNRNARRLAKTRLTGNFGSEVLRAMSTFKPIGLAPELLSSSLRQGVDRCAQKPPGAGDHPVSFSLFREVPFNLFGTLCSGRSQVTFRTPYLDNEIAALAYRAPLHLRKSTGPALRLVKRGNPELSKLPTDRGHTGATFGLAHGFRRAYSEVTFKLDYYYSEGLPNWLTPVEPIIERINSSVRILGLHKFLHYRRWFQRPLAPYLEEVLTDAQTTRSSFWNRDFLAKMARTHISGQKNYLREINAVLTLEAAERLLLRSPKKAERAEIGPANRLQAS